MRIIQADIVNHVDSKGKRHAIYSMDFQPLPEKNNGLIMPRLATGGGGMHTRAFMNADF